MKDIRQRQGRMGHGGASSGVWIWKMEMEMLVLEKD